MSLAGIAGLLLRKIFGSRNERILQSFRETIDRINGMEDAFKHLSDAALRAKTEEFRKRLKAGESREDILPDAFATVREASKRTLRMRHYDVQLIGGMVLHRGMIAEMVTGEGKTLVATLPAYLNAVCGSKVHIITVNDYLAQRDRDWMGPLHEFLGLSVGALQGDMDYVARHAQYACDITYGTNSEFGFDYLRDNMKYGLEQQVQKRRDFAIIDEVDSVLIDEARTPLIISGPTEESTDKYYQSNRVAKLLKEGTHFEVKEKEHTVVLNEAGVEKAEQILNIGSFYEGKNLDWPHHIDQALKAHSLYKKDRDYVIKDGDIVIVDEFTGRLQPGRRWSDGLHQAIEAKENLRIKEENQTLATITIQNFFKLYGKLAGMTGTAITEATEFDKIYGLDVVVIPTNKPLRRLNYPDVIYRTEKEKTNAIEEEIVKYHELGRPILVGTISIEKSELLSKRLQRRGIKHEVLNAKNHAREAEIIADAGLPGHVTIATNMAGRGTDIILGDGVAERGGLHVIGTERHESRRIDNQLRGRCGRQGDPGSSRFFLSLEDDLMRIFASEKVSRILERIGMTEGQEIESRLVSKQIEWAQRKVEETNFERRKNLMEYDDVMNEQRTEVYKQRNALLEGIESKETIVEWLEELADAMIDLYLPEKEPRESWEWNEVEKWQRRKLGSAVSKERLMALNNRDGVHEAICRYIRDDVYRKKEQEIGEERMRRIECWLMLQILDTKWKDHLLSMDHLRAGIGFRGYAGIDPKIAYKQEGYDLFSDMIHALKEETTDHIFHVHVQEESEPRNRSVWNVQESLHHQVGGFEAVRQREAASRHVEKPKPIRSAQKKVGRNDPCPCGSGKKHKKCCGKAA